ncbi:hypothetical protein ABMA28_003732 [Loxostege sticticalis]|uniref:ascorbate ferrireductase (transmembrane) n=1 Tax=Loxostege sticticalis TaxID=481309 RepID=A0ABD0STU1_LOXSC
MPPNFNDLSPPERIDVVEAPKDNVVTQEIVPSNVGIKAVRSFATLLTHILIGIIVGVSLFFSLRNGTPLGATPQHVILCVIGYQFLMAEAILTLAPDSWVASLSLKHRRWVHTGLQIIGSVLAIVGSFIKMADKEVNFNTLHGKFGLAAVVFTSVSLVNGCASLYAYELRKCIPGILSKLTHICFGTVAFVMASVCLCYGIDKGSFRNALSTRFADSLIIMTGTLTTIVIINPLLTFYVKFSGAIKN